MPKILVSDAIADAGVKILCGAGAVEVNATIAPDALLAAIADYDALIVRSRTHVTAPLIHAATRLRVIGRAGAGVDNIDVAAAQQRGIGVINAPNSVAVAVAEHTMGLMIALARGIPQADVSLKRGDWAKNKFMGVELSGKMLGLIGLGRIGALVALRAAAFGMRVIAFDPYITRERADAFGVVLLDSLHELLASSDFVSIHTVLLPETRGLIGAGELARMKPNARLVFCARGGVVDEAALWRALESEELAGAALDVFENEPPYDNPLVYHPRVIVTPHLGAMTAEAQTRAAIEVAEQVVAVLKGVRPFAISTESQWTPPN